MGKQFFDDLRGFIKETEEMGECQVVEGANWEEEIGLLTEVAAITPGTPLLLFDSIKGYPKGYRVASNVFTSLRRCTLFMGLPDGLGERDIVERWRRRLLEEFKPLPPVEVESAPVKENIHVGEDVDLFEFPAPKWHPLDGGRYIGTADMVITRDPDEGWVNLGTYRVQVHDKAVATIMIAPGKHADIMRRKYWSKGQSCPAVVTCGQAPLLFLLSCSPTSPLGVSEYDYAGWLAETPIEVTTGVVTGLPIPATAEIALEGEILPPEVESVEEGPFGEFTGYYASGTRPEAVFRVKAILHRNEPIIQGSAPSMNWRANNPGIGFRGSAEIWNELDKVLPGVKGVWYSEAARGCYIVISLKQMYSGHAKQAAVTVASSRHVASFCRWVIVVDDDIDPFNISEVLWALGTRCDPATSIDIVRGWRSNALDPCLPPEKRRQQDLTRSLAIVQACKPYYWIEQFPPSIKLDPQVVERVKQKWAWLFK